MEVVAAPERDPGLSNPREMKGGKLTLVVSRITIPCSRSNLSFAQRVPSHFVKLAISDFVRPKLSNARKSLRCQV